MYGLTRRWVGLFGLGLRRELYRRMRDWSIRGGGWGLMRYPWWWSKDGELVWLCRMRHTFQLQTHPGHVIR